MAISSSSGSTFQFSGLASGFNTDTILQKMVEAEKAPLTRLGTRQAQATNQQTAWRSLNTRLLALDSQAARLQDDSVFQARTAAVSDTDVLTAAASPGQDLGSYQLTVVNLARQHQVKTNGYATKDAAVGTGQVTLAVGPAQYAPIEVTTGTLEGLRDAINGANLPVQAAIVDAGEAAGAERYRLVLNSGTSGTAGHLTINLDLSGGTAPTLSDLQTDLDAQLKLGNLDLKSSSNTVTDVIPGVTLKLKKAGTVDLGLTRDSNSVRSGINSVLEQFNGLSDFFTEQFAYDSATGKTGTLFGDSTLLQIQSDLFNSATNRTHVENSNLNSLAAVGIGLDAAGKLAVTDSQALDKALARPQELGQLFKAVSTRLRDTINRAVAPRTGLVTLEDQRLTTLNADLENSARLVNAKATRTEERLRRMFLDMESAMSKLKSQGQALNAQLGTNISSSSA